MTEQELKLLRDECRLLAVRLDNLMELKRSIQRTQGTQVEASRDWFEDPLFQSCRALGYNIQAKLKGTFRRRPSGV